MALTLTLTYGSTTITLNSAAAHCEVDDDKPYTPQAGGPNEEFVTESFGVVIQHTTAANISGIVQGINKAFLQAIQYQKTHVGDKLYLNYQPNGYASSYRSEIVNGAFQPDDDAQPNMERSLTVTGVIAFTRRNFWEGAETQIPLTNGNGTNNTAGLNVYNCNDGVGASPNKHHNYAAVAAADVLGDLPAPVRLDLSGGTPTQAKFQVFNNVFCSPATLSHWFDLSGSADVACSGGEYKSQTVNAGATVSVAIGNLDAAKMIGAYFKILLALSLNSGALSAYKFRPYVTMGSSTQYGPSTYWTPLVTAKYFLLDMGAMRLPPDYQTGFAYGNTQAFGVEITNPTGGASVFRLDAGMIGPLDGMLTVDSPSISACLTAHYHTSGYDGHYWIMASATDDAEGIDSPLTGVNDHLMVYPGLVQRIYIITGDTVATPGAVVPGTNNYEPFYKYTVKLWYRPRRLTL